MEATICNRLCQSICKSGKDYPVQWDGKSNGIYLPVESYNYVIDLYNVTNHVASGITIVK